MNLLTQTILSGLMSGAVYALLAVGLIIVYRTSGVLNLAYGEAYAITGLGTVLLVKTGLPVYAAAVVALCAAVAFSVALDRFVLQPRSHWALPNLILVTLGVAFLSRGILMVAAGVDAQSFPRLVAGRPFRFLGGALPTQGLLLIVLGFAAAASTAVFINRSSLGRQLKACAANPDAAQLLGIDVRRSRLLAFAVAGLLGGLAAILLVPMISIDFQAGLGMTMRGFIAAALAGMVPSRGVAAGLVLGLFEAFVSSYWDALAQDPVVFAVLIGIALWQSRQIRHGGGLRA